MNILLMQKFFLFPFRIFLEGLPAVVQPEPFLRILSNPFLDPRVDRLRHTAHIGSAVIGLFDKYPGLHRQDVMAAWLAMHENGKDRHFAVQWQPRL